MTEGIAGVKYGSRPKRITADRQSAVLNAAVAWSGAEREALGPITEDREAGLKLSDVAVQMLRRAVLLDTLHADATRRIGTRNLLGRQARRRGRIFLLLYGERYREAGGEFFDFPRLYCVVELLGRPGVPPGVFDICGLIIGGLPLQLVEEVARVEVGAPPERKSLLGHVLATVLLAVSSTNEAYSRL